MDEELAIISAKVTPHPLHFVQHLLPLEKAYYHLRIAKISSAYADLIHFSGLNPSMTDLTAFLTPLRNAWLLRSAGSELSRAGAGTL